MQPERSQVSLFEIELAEAVAELRELQPDDAPLGEEPEDEIGESPSPSQER